MKLLYRTILYLAQRELLKKVVLESTKINIINFFVVLCFSCIRYILIKLYEVLTLDGIINSVSENVLHHNSSYQKINDTPMQFLRNIKFISLMGAKLFDKSV